METLQEFKRNKKVTVGCKYPKKIKGCYGIYDYYCYYDHLRHVKHPGEKSYNLLWNQHSEIIKAMHKLMREELLDTGTVDLPYGLGSLVMYKKENNAPYFKKDGKLRIPYIVNWDATLELWYNDEEAHANKTRIYYEIKDMYRVFYSKKDSRFKNQSYYKFRLNRAFKTELIKRAKDNKLDNFFVIDG